MKVHFTSLGCPRNRVDTEVMVGILLKAGYEPTATTEDADYLVVNTCGFLESARQESLDTIQGLIDVKKNGAKVVVTGCMVQNHKEQIREAIPEVSYLLGSGDVNKILDAINQDRDFVTDARSFLQQGEVPRTVTTRHFAYLKIAEGCLKRCSFCKIPGIKGPLKSKPREQVLSEVRALLSQNIREIILIAQDLGDWGKENKEAFESLLEEIFTIPGDYKIRLLYLYPDEITAKLVDLMKSEPRLLKYLDMPIQHVNDQILKAMRRKTRKEHIVQTIEMLRREVPDVVIRTSLMVGFPGETEEQFEELLQFVKSHPLDNVGVFMFSKEEGTHAATLTPQVPEEVKQSRHKRLMELQLEMASGLNQRWVGQTLPVVIEGFHPDSRHLMVGRFHGQCPEIDGQVIINDGRAVTEFGREYRVKITENLGYDLLGTALPLKTSKLKLAHGSSRHS